MILIALIRLLTMKLIQYYMLIIISYNKSTLILKQFIL